MDYQKRASKRSGLKWAIPISVFVHLLLLTALLYNRSDPTLRALGTPGITWIDVHVGASQGQAEVYPKPSPPRVEEKKVLEAGATSDDSDDKVSNVANHKEDPWGDGGEGGKSEILRKIRLKIERAKYYPRLAKRSKMEGSPLVEFKIREDGSIAYVRLQKSSGSPWLDEAATQTVLKGAPYPRYPKPISLYITYSLGPTPP